MKFGVREICDVFLKTKVANQVVGNKTIPAAGTPVCHFDSLKTSTVEGAATAITGTNAGAFNAVTYNNITEEVA